MKRFAVLALAVATGAATLNACENPSLPDISVEIHGHVESDGVEIGGGTGGVLPAGAKVLRFLVTVKAPRGPWDLTISTDGSLAVDEADAGPTTSRSFLSSGDTQSTTIAVPLVIKSHVGSARIHASVGGQACDLTFTIAPVLPPDLNICLAGPNGDCSSITSSGIGTGGPLTISLDGKTETLPFPTPISPLQKDDEVMVLITPSVPVTVGESWPLTLTSAGAISLVVDGGATTKETVDVTQATPKLIFPAKLTGIGDGVLGASVGDGVQKQFFVSVSTATTAVRQVSFLDHASLLAVNQVTVCTTTAQGSIDAMVDSGSLAKSSAPILTSDPLICPAVYPGQASFVWTGAAKSTTWMLTISGTNQTIQFVPMLGTALLACAMAPESTWVDPPVEDAGAADSGVDAGAIDAGGPLLTKVNAKLVLKRNAFAPLIEPSTNCDPGELLSKTKVVITAPPGVLPGKSEVTTDANGVAYVDFTAPTSVTDVKLILSVGDTVLTTVIVSRLTP